MKIIGSFWPYKVIGMGYLLVDVLWDWVFEDNFVENTYKRHTNKFDYFIKNSFIFQVKIFFKNAKRLIPSLKINVKIKLH